MKIVVCIKQVPDTADIKWTENNTIQREGVESVINPYDLYALETALRLKDKYEDIQITVLTMGPPQAEEILKKALAMGCDEAYLLSDRKFAGADTVATSRTLAAAVKTIIPDASLVICGQFATDGDTAQTGPSIAQHLDLAQITYVKEVQELGINSITVKKEVEDGIETVKSELPAVICMLKCDYEPRTIYIDGYIDAQDYKVETFGYEKLGLNQEDVGMKGSPTYVSKAFRPQQKTGGEMVVKESTREYAEFLNEKITELKATMD